MRVADDVSERMERNPRIVWAWQSVASWISLLVAPSVRAIISNTLVFLVSRGCFGSAAFFARGLRSCFAGPAAAYSVAGSSTFCSGVAAISGALRV